MTFIDLRVLGGTPASKDAVALSEMSHRSRSANFVWRTYGLTARQARFVWHVFNKMTSRDAYFVWSIGSYYRRMRVVWRTYSAKARNLYAVWRTYRYTRRKMWPVWRTYANTVRRFYPVFNVWAWLVRPKSASKEKRKGA